LVLSVFFFTGNLHAMMQTSRGGLFSSRKAVNEMIMSESDSLAKFSTASILKVLIYEVSLSKVIYGYYSFSASAVNSIMVGPDYHAGEFSLTRGFSDKQVFGLLGVGYRLGKFDYKEHWLCFFTSTGYLPSPDWGIETSIAYYWPLSQRSARLRMDVLGIYKVQMQFFDSFDFGLQTSFYVIPSGELGTPDVEGHPQSDALVEEFIQIEGGIIVRYHVRNFITFEALVTNILFINQTNYEFISIDGGVSRIVGRAYSYAPKVMLSLSIRL
jgi:hypothetical protein